LTLSERSPSCSKGTLTLDYSSQDKFKLAVLLVAFWFDGGLFTLPTAAVFWILLELGTALPQQTGIPGKQIEPCASTAG
jgi:hypothetical protein